MEFLLILAFIIFLSITLGKDLFNHEVSMLDALMAIAFIGGSSVFAITFLGLESPFLTPIIVATVIVGLCLLFNKAIKKRFKGNNH